jgi:hypothetical protein
VSTSLHHAVEQRIEDFRRAVRSATRRDLLNNVDHYLEQMDQAKARGDRTALEWAKARWNCVWNELDARDGIQVEKAS